MTAWRIAAVLAPLALLVPGSGARADEVALGFESRAEYDTNVFRTERDEEDDFVLRGGPVVTARSEKGDLLYELRYRPEYEGFFEVDGISGWNHFVNLDGTWHWSDATRFEVEEVFGRTRSLSEFTEPIPEVQRQERRRLWRNVFRGGVEHEFGPRWVGSLDVEHSIHEFSSETQSDARSVGASGVLHYVLTRRDRVGLGASATRQDFDAVPASATSRDETSVFYHGFASWIHAFDPTLSLSAQGGPTWFDSDRGGSDLTAFGSVRITKDWRRASAYFEYTRSSSTVSGLAASTERDGFVLHGDYRPSEKWRAFVTGSWSRRASLDQDVCTFLGLLVAFGSCQDIGFPGVTDQITRVIDIRVFQVRAGLERRIGRHSAVFGRAIYFDQTDNGKVKTASEFDDLRIFFGVRYELDGMHF